MTYSDLANKFARRKDVAISTMMGSPCLRYRGEFIGMMFDKAESLIVKLPADRVDQLIATGEGMEFNFTSKRFKEWVLLPLSQEDRYPDFLEEALAYAKQRLTN